VVAEEIEKVTLKIFPAVTVSGKSIMDTTGAAKILDGNIKNNNSNIINTKLV